MPEVTQYEPGTPSWVDIGSPDMAATIAFYSGLFGWEPNDLGEEAGHYTFMMLKGKAAAAIGPAQNPGPPTWATYITVANVDTTAQVITNSGGTLVVPPMDVMDAGRMAVAQDPTGAFFSIWQPGRSIGCEIVNEPGAVCWNELATRDAKVALDFYEKVLGVATRRSDEYSEFQIGDRSVAGCMPMGDEFPPEVPPHWLVYFAVSDVDAAADKAASLGANVMFPPKQVPGVGRFTVLMDPQGAVFAIITMETSTS